MGDGSLYLDKKDKYHTKICFNKTEIEYRDYVKRLLEEYFSYKFCIAELPSEFLAINVSVFVGTYLIRNGLKSGNKVDNKLIVPKWVNKKKEYMKRFLRGFFDTDGCVYCKYGLYAQIQIKTACRETTESIWKLMARLGFHPTKIQKEEKFKNDKLCYTWKLYLTRQKEIQRFFVIIKPKNPKHIGRYKKIKMGALGRSRKQVHLASDSNF